MTNHHKTTARTYRKNAQLHTLLALQALHGRSGMTEQEKVAAVKTAAGHLANAMSMACAAVGALEAATDVTVVDIFAATDDLVAGLEQLLEKGPEQ